LDGPFVIQEQGDSVEISPILGLCVERMVR
jgi:hypothetical protein